MDEWIQHNLGELIEVQNGYAFKSNDFDDFNGTPVIKIKNIASGELRMDDVQYFPHSIEGLERFIICKNDILIALTGSHVHQPSSIVGKVARYTKDKVSLLNQRVGKITSLDGGITNEDFIYWFFKQWEVTVELALNAGGSANQANISGNLIKQLQLELPPLPEQKAIASVLSSLDDKIDLLHRQNRTLEALPETLFRQWFVEEAQDDWEEMPLSSIAEHKKINIRPDQNPEVLYNHYSIPAFDNGKHPVKELGSEIKSNKYQVIANSILISKLNPRFPRVWAIGNLLDYNSICSTEFQVIFPLKAEYFSFIYFFLISKPVADELTGAAGGTSGSHQRVKPEDIFNLKFQMPAKQKIDDFNSIISENWKRITNNMLQIRTLEKLRDTLLPKLMSGEVRVEYKN